MKCTPKYCFGSGDLDCAWCKMFPPKIKENMEYDLWEKYAALLRRAWLNPSYKPWQEDVYKFERENIDHLDEYFEKWQKIE